MGGHDAVAKPISHADSELLTPRKPYPRYVNVYALRKCRIVAKVRLVYREVEISVFPRSTFIEQLFYRRFLRRVVNFDIVTESF